MIILLGVFLFSFLLPNALSAQSFHDNFSNYADGSFSPNYLGYLKVQAPTATNSYRHTYQTGLYNFRDYNQGSNLIYAHVDPSPDPTQSYVVDQAKFNLNNNESDIWRDTTGFFNSTYSFDNENELDNWTITEATNTEVSIVDAYSSGIGLPSSAYDNYEHENVLRLKDDSASGLCSARLSFQEIINGTISFWWSTSNYGNNVFISLNQGGYTFFQMDTNAGNFRIYEATGTTTIKSNILNGVWYYLSLTFNSVLNKVSISINNVDEGTYNSYLLRDLDYVNNIYIRTDTSQTIDFFIDGLEYSWNHTIGIYNASYSFTNDSIGSNPSYWSVDETGGSINVYSEISNHSKVLEIKDTSGASSVQVYNDFDSIESGTIEFWIYSNDASYSSNIDIKDGSTYKINAGIYNEQFYYYTSGYNYFGNVYDNTWYHIRIDFECGSGGYEGLSADKFYFHVNGYRYGPFSFYSVATTLSRLNFRTEPTQQITYYTDSVGYSWLDNYTINDNFNPDTLENQYDVISNYYPYDEGINSQYYFYYTSSLFGSSGGGGLGETVRYYIYIHNSYLNLSIEEYNPSYSKVYVNYSLAYVNEQKYIEIETHSYLGAYENSTLACNSKIIIYFDDTIVFEYESHLEYSSLANPDMTYKGTSYFKPRMFNFYTYYNIFEGYRILADLDHTNSYDSFIDIPRFDDYISLLEPTPEPPTYESGITWYVSGFSIIALDDIFLYTTHFNTSFTPLSIVSVQIPYHFELLPFRYGAWYDVIVNGIIYVGNLLAIAFNAIIFAFFTAVEYTLVILLFVIIVLIWNFAVAGLVYAWLFILECIFYLIPWFINWIETVMIPIILDALVFFISFVLGYIIWLFSGGPVSVFSVNDIIQAIGFMVDNIFTVYYNIVIVVLNNLFNLILFIGIYLEIYYMLYFKYLMTKTRGYYNGNLQIEMVLRVWSYPIRLLARISKTLSNLVPKLFPI